MKQFLKQVLKNIKPENQEYEKINQIFEQISKEIKTHSPHAQPFLGGSAAKNTRLKNNKEIDIFLKYALKTKNISEKTLKSLKKYAPEIVKASRNYASFNLENFKIEIIPVYEIKKTEQAENIMDCSPFHVEYVKKHLKHPDETMLLKHFCKQNGLYGAESYQQGLSGYSIELLTIHYKTFENTISNVAKWKIGKKIILEQEQPLKKSQKTSLIIIDPVQSLRNASNALSEEKFKKFVKISKEYTKNPSKNFFKNKNTLEYFKSLKGNKEIFFSKKFIVKGKNDIFLAKLNKKIGRISSELIQLGFSNKHGLIPEENSFFFIIPEKIPEKIIHKGPETRMKEHCKKFREKWTSKKVFEKKGRLYVELEREITNGEKAIKKIVSSFS
ncbi:MAG: hypothetical protein GON13_00810 [Nanoarchaeota archaeon]|nr:hypothetical protein [Nanoarchaeota archaeon]